MPEIAKKKPPVLPIKRPNNPIYNEVINSKKKDIRCIKIYFLKLLIIKF